MEREKKDSEPPSRPSSVPPPSEPEGKSKPRSQKLHEWQEERSSDRHSVPPPPPSSPLATNFPISFYPTLWGSNEIPERLIQPYSRADRSTISGQRLVFHRRTEEAQPGEKPWVEPWEQTKERFNRTLVNNQWPTAITDCLIRILKHDVKQVTVTLTTKPYVRWTGEVLKTSAAEMRRLEERLEKMPDDKRGIILGEVDHITHLLGGHTRDYGVFFMLKLKEPKLRKILSSQGKKKG